MPSTTYLSWPTVVYCCRDRCRWRLPLWIPSILEHFVFVRYSRFQSVAVVAVGETVVVFLLVVAAAVAEACPFPLATFEPFVSIFEHPTRG